MKSGRRKKRRRCREVRKKSPSAQRTQRGRKKGTLRFPDRDGAGAERRGARRGKSGKSLCGEEETEGAPEREWRRNEAKDRRAGRRGIQTGGEAGERVAVGDDGNRSAGANESAGEAAGRASDAPGGHGGSDGGAPALEQLCRHGFGGSH